MFEGPKKIPAAGERRPCHYSFPGTNRTFTTFGFLDCVFFETGNTLAWSMAFEGDGYAIEVFRSLVTLGTVRRDRLDRTRRTRDRSARLTQRAWDYAAVTPLAGWVQWPYWPPLALPLLSANVFRCFASCH